MCLDGILPRQAGRGSPQCGAAGLRQRADVAQEVERVLGKDEVTGSNPVIGSSLDHAIEGRQCRKAAGTAGVAGGGAYGRRSSFRERADTWRRKSSTGRNRM